MSTQRSRITSALVAVALILTCVACSQNKVGASDWGCLYKGGPIEGRGLKKVIAPGKSGGTTTGDKLVTIPADVRYYIIDQDAKTQDFNAAPILLLAQGNVEVSVEVQARFVFNENVCDWYTRHGKRNDKDPGLKFDDPAVDGAGKPTGWSSFLNTGLRPFILDASRDFVPQFPWLTMYSNQSVTSGDKTDSVNDILGADIASTLREQLQRSLGGDYFCGPAYVFDGKVDGTLNDVNGKPGCPDMEVTVMRIAPTDPELPKSLGVAESSRAQQAVTEAQRDQAVRQALADQAVKEAEISRDKAVAVAKANADTEVAKANLTFAQAQLEVTKAQAQADAQFCIQLAQVGVDCAAYKNGYPQVVGGDAGVFINPPVAPTTTVPR